MRISLSFALLSLALTAGILPACQQGLRKDQANNVYKEGIAEEEKLDKELRSFDIFLVEVTDEKKIQEKQRLLKLKLNNKGSNPEVIEATLEKYVSSTQRLITLGDDKVVLFPERNWLQKKLNYASKLLGSIYADKKWDGIKNPVETPMVDRAEYDVRFARFGATLNKLGKYGVDFNKFEKAPEQLRKRNKAELLQLSEECGQSMADVQRNKELAERNNHWDLQGLDLFTRNTKTFASIMYQVQAIADVEAAKK